MTVPTSVPSSVPRKALILPAWNGGTLGTPSKHRSDDVDPKLPAQTGCRSLGDPPPPLGPPSEALYAGGLAAPPR